MNVCVCKIWILELTTFPNSSVTYNEYATSWTTEELELDSRLGRDFSLCHHVRLWEIPSLLGNYLGGGAAFSWSKAAGA
jgi:hypothetical protein